MPYKEKVKLLQQIEDYKRPAKSAEECKKYFEAYCKEHGLTTPSEIAASAQNPMYYDYLLDYVGYAPGSKKDEHVEHVRSTYIRATGRFLMVKRVAEALAKEKKCEVRMITPPCEFLPGATPNTTVCRAEIRIEALLQKGTEQDWQTVFLGTGTAKRQGGGGYNDFYIEKAETAARARAIAAAGIGIDIQGGLSTIEDAQAAYEEDVTKPDTDERMQISVMEAEIRGCLNAPDPMAAIQIVAKGMKEKSKTLNKGAQQHLSNVFEEIMAKIAALPKPPVGDAK